MSFRTLVKKFIPRKLFRTIEPWGHLGEAVLFNTLYGFPARKLKVIGVTGTNGKTSTCFLIQRMLHEAGFKVGLMTTVGYGAGADIKPQIHHMTNVTVPELMRRLKGLKRAGVEWLVLETTSQALAQNRVWGVPFHVAVMTNVTHEHLDWHGTFEHYRDAKKKLFELTNRNRQGLRIGVVNADDPSAQLFVSAINMAVTYGVKQGDVQATNVKLTPTSSRYTATVASRQSPVASSTTGDKQLETSDYNIVCNLPGEFYVYNSLAAVAVGRALGLSKQQIENGIAALKEVEGRMTRIDEGQDFDVIVDYAHTPDSFERLFKDLKPVVKGRMIAMFGSAGHRDEAKRAVQGRLAGKYCDIVIITEEDDRDCDGLAIMEEIAAGAEATGKIKDQDLFLVHQREQAIQTAIDMGRAGDVVLLLGKGHEKTIERADGEHPWDEINTAKIAVKNLLQTT